LNCAKGAALATGTELSKVQVIAAIHQCHANKTLAELMYENIKLVGMPEWTEAEHKFAKSLQKELGKKESGMLKEIGKLGKPASVFTGGPSSDHGDVTLIAPTATIRFPGTVPGTIGHHWSNVTCNYGSSAWKGLNAGAKAMAATAIDLLTLPEELKKIRQEFEDYSKEHPYKSFLPKEARPPLDINEELMDKYRPLMEQYQIDN
jgi:aminobenzoyl-glutamate utilization protein B